MKGRKELEKIKRVELIEARKAKGLSQKQLAKQLFIGQSAMSKIENGSQPITLEQASKLTKLLKIKITDLGGTSKIGMELNELKAKLNKVLEIDLQIADLLTQAEKKEIDFDTFHRRLQYFEGLKRENNEREVV